MGERQWEEQEQGEEAQKGGHQHTTRHTWERKVEGVEGWREWRGGGKGSNTVSAIISGFWKISPFHRGEPARL